MNITAFFFSTDDIKVLEYNSIDLSRKSLTSVFTLPTLIPLYSSTLLYGIIGDRICDSEFAADQIEWQIIRLGSGYTFDGAVQNQPVYAPFVAAGFFFTLGTV